MIIRMNFFKIFIFEVQQLLDKVILQHSNLPFDFQSKPDLGIAEIIMISLKFQVYLCRNILFSMTFHLRVTTCVIAIHTNYSYCNYLHCNYFTKNKNTTGMLVCMILISIFHFISFNRRLGTSAGLFATGIFTLA